MNKFEWRSIMYEAITKEERAEIEEFLYNQLLKDSWEERKETKGEHLVCYCKMQDIEFIIEVTKDELETLAKLTIDMLEELKNMNNAGFNKEKYEALFEQFVEDKDEDIVGFLTLWNEAFSTEEIKHIVSEIGKTRKINATYATLIACPQLIHTAISVYAVLVDTFDDTRLYYICAYFLFRGIMYTCSREL